MGYILQKLKRTKKFKICIAEVLNCAKCGTRAELLGWTLSQKIRDMRGNRYTNDGHQRSHWTLQFRVSNRAKILKDYYLLIFDIGFCVVTLNNTTSVV